MRASSLSLVMTLASCITLSLAAPATIEITSSLRPRRQICQNAPATVAGKLLPRREMSSAPSATPVSPRSNNIVWCVPGTQTYVTLQMIKLLPSSPVVDLLQESYNAVQDHIQKLGDGVIPGGLFQWVTARGYVLQAWSSNNHQTTWGALGAAVTALLNYMTATNLYGAVVFYIYDGPNEVGGGTIGST